MNRPDDIEPEDMVNGQKVFTYKTGLIILSSDQLITDQLRNNDKFFLYPTPLHQPALSIFISLDIAPEITKAGLPITVKKFLLKK